MVNRARVREQSRITPILASPGTLNGPEGQHSLTAAFWSYGIRTEDVRISSPSPAMTIVGAAGSRDFMYFPRPPQK
jgi:hypothetical protein